MNKTTNRLLLAVLTLQVLALGSLWGTNTLPIATAQIPDPGAQRERQLDELKELNTKMDKLVEILAGGKLQVQVHVVPADKK